MHLRNCRAAAAAGEEPWGEPGVDVRRQVTDDIAATGMDPHRRLVDTWRIGHQNERVTGP